MAILSNSGLRTWTNSGHFLYRKKMFWWLQNHQTMLTPHSHKLSVLVWKTWLNNALVYQFQSGLKSITTNVARSYAVSTSKIFMMGRKKEESLIFLYFTLRKNELEFSPTQSINQSNNLFTSICGMGLPWSSEPSPLGSHNERKVGNNFLKRGESEWSKNISDT